MFRDRQRRKHLSITDSPSETLTVADEDNLMTQIEARDESEQVGILIGQLPKQQQLILKLHAVNNLSANEIEEETGLSATNIRSLLSRARKNIKQRFNNT